MAFAIRNLSVLAYANGFTFCHYKSTKDTLAEIGASNYFLDAGDMLSPGDMIAVTASDGGKIIIVTESDGSITNTAPLS